MLRVMDGSPAYGEMPEPSPVPSLEEASEARYMAWWRELDELESFHLGALDLYHFLRKHDAIGELEAFAQWAERKEYLRYDRASGLAQPLVVRELSLPERESTGRTFREVYCELHRCGDDQFERRVLRACLSPQARLLGSLVRLVRPGVYDSDLQLLSDLGKYGDANEICDEFVLYLNSDELYEDRPLAWFFSLRPRPERLKRLAAETLK